MSRAREGRSDFSLFAVQRLVPRLRAHRTALSVAAIALVVSAAIGLAFPLIVRHLKGSGDEVRRQYFIDPWNNPYIYTPLGGKKYKIVSTGEDGQEGTEDDVVYPLQETQ